MSGIRSLVLFFFHPGFGGVGHVSVLVFLFSLLFLLFFSSLALFLYYVV